MKKLLSILLAVLMVATLGVVNVTAEGEEPATETPTESITESNVETNLETTNSEPVQLAENSESTAVAVIGAQSYSTLNEAVVALTDEVQTEIKLVNNANGGIVIPAGKNVIIDLNGFEIDVIKAVGSTGTETNGLQLLKGSTITIKNGLIKASAPEVKIMIKNYANLTLENVVVKGQVNNCGQLVVNGADTKIDNGDSWAITTGNYVAGDIITTEINAGNITSVAIEAPLWETGGATVNEDVTTTINGGTIGKIGIYDWRQEYGEDYLNAPLLKNWKFIVNGGSINQNNFVAKIGNYYYATFEDAINKVDDNQTITLLTDNTINGNLVINNGKKFLLDLDNNKLTVNGYVSIYNAFVTIDKGEIDILNGNHLFLYTSAIDQKYCSLNIKSKATVRSNYGVIINQNSNGTDGTENYGVELNVDGSIYGKTAGIWVMGNIHTNIETSNNPVYINISDNATIEAGYVGLGLNGSAVTTLGKCKILGKADSGLEIRAGKLIVNGAEISSEANKLEVVPNGSGNTTTGAAIAVSQHTTKLPIDVVINDGKFSAYTPLNHADPQNNGLDNIKITVNGGIFNPILGGTCPINSHNLTKFVNDASFYNYAPEDKYAADGKAVFFARKNLYEVDTDPDKVSVLFDYSYVEKDFDLALGNFAWQNFTFTRNGKELDHHYVTYTVTKGDALKVNEYGYLDFTDKTGLVEVTATCGSQSASAYVYIVDSYETTDEGAASSDEDTTSSTLNTESSKVIESIVANDSKTFEAKASLANGVTFEELKNDILGGKTVETVLDSNKVDTVSNETTNAAVAAAEAQLGGGAKIAGSYDIQVKLIVDGKQKANITSLDNAIQLQIELPEEIRTVPSGYSREVAIVRMHNGVATVIAKGNVSELGSTITCSSNLFSEYVLVYRDTLDYVYTKPAAKKPVVNTSVR